MAGSGIWIVLMIGVVFGLLLSMSMKFKRLRQAEEAEDAEQLTETEERKGAESPAEDTFIAASPRRVRKRKSRSRRTGAVKPAVEKIKDPWAPANEFVSGLGSADFQGGRVGVGELDASLVDRSVKVRPLLGIPSRATAPPLRPAVAVSAQ